MNHWNDPIRAEQKPTAASGRSRIPRRTAAIGIAAMLLGTAQAQNYTWTPGCSGPKSGLLAIDFGEIEWQVCLEQRGIKGVWIANASVRRPNESGFTRVIEGAGPAENYVGYNDGPFWNPTAVTEWYDMNVFSVLDSVSVVDLPRVGIASLETLSGDSATRVVVELRDLGPAWLDKAHNGAYPDRARRLLEVVAWSVYDAGNYNYIVQYGFRNDGTISFRCGATGFNLPMHPTIGHMHSTLWHIHFNLFGDSSDQVELDTHVASISASATDSNVPAGFEQLYEWSDSLEEFPTLAVHDAGHLNYHGHAPGYSIQTAYFEGLSRHNGLGEAWTHFDSAIAQWRSSELGWQTTQEQDPLNYIFGPQQFLEAVSDPIVWVKTAAYHDPHDEDRSSGDLPCGVTGITGMHWSGVDLKPRNFFEFNPVGGAASLSFAPLPANCVSWWKFNESETPGQVAITKDAITGVDGAMFGGLVIGPGLHGGGVTFDGSNDWVSPSANASYLDMTGPDFTIEAYVNVAAGAAGTDVILDKRVPFSAGYELFLFNGQIAVQLSRAGIFLNYISTTVVPQNVNAHIACVVNRSANPPQVRFYVNGVITPDSPFAVSPTLIGSLSNPAIARIGQHASGGSFYQGMLDELSVYTRALTKTEIESIAKMGGKSGGR